MVGPYEARELFGGWQGAVTRLRPHKQDPFQPFDLANVGGNWAFPSSGGSSVIYQNLNTAAAATFDLSVTAGTGPGCAGPGSVTFSWTDAAHIPQSITIPNACGGSGVRTSLPAACKGAPAPGITVTYSGGMGYDISASGTWTIEQVH